LLNHELSHLGVSKDLFRSTPGTAFYEARTLVISFLYQASYYKALSRRLRYAASDEEISPLPNRAIVDVISLYPGGLAPEDFLAKVENYLIAAEQRGLPYTGVLIDGIHNVFVQYPMLEYAVTFWPQLYNTLRRQGVTVVTTHTEFELRHSALQSGFPLADFEQAQKKAAPLLSVLVSAADYVFELAPTEFEGRGMEYRLSVRGMLGEDPPTGYLTGDRQGCRLGGFRTSQLELFDSEERRFSMPHRSTGLLS
jgi:hypothetical protein